MTEEELSQLKTDLKLLMSFAPATCARQVEPGLMAMFYVTGSYNGDLAIATRLEEMCRRYDIDPEDIDDPELDELEEDFG